MEYGLNSKFWTPSSKPSVGLAKFTWGTTSACVIKASHDSYIPLKLWNYQPQKVKMHTQETEHFGVWPTELKLPPGIDQNDRDLQSNMQNPLLTAIK